MYDIDDEWEYGEKRAQLSAMLEDIVLDTIIEAIAKIKRRNDWLKQADEGHQEEIKF